MARTARPPVIAVMGHIDHGKSSLLDYIREENIVAGEAGGITQHVAAYIAEHNGRFVTFLDTPGHEAFKALRTRGAAAADISILVVAADEGVMPQTLDALAAIKEANIPYIIAITKIDKNNADIAHTKNSLVEHGIYIEGMGGDVAYAPISSKTGEGIPGLLDLVLLAADLLELTADPEASATGFVLESTQDPKRGSSATLIIKNGTLTLGRLPAGRQGFVVAGDAYAPIRFIEDFRGARVEHAGPSEPVRISGFSKLPTAGALFNVVKSKKEALDATRSVVLGDRSASQNGLVEMPVEGVGELPLVVKADVAGSVDAIVHELAKTTHERAVVRLISSGVGSVSEADVKTAYAAGGVIISFNVGMDAIASELAERDKVAVFPFSIIYELTAKVAELLAERAPSVTAEKELGRALVLKTFSAGAKKQVLGARYVSGILSVGDRVKLVRKGVEVARGSIKNLQQARADVKEIKVEGDFGAEIEARENAAYGDEIIAFTISES
ncbi:translation initiation factor IF-2 [Candidatus Kaiserbacteria bacterium RIFCSPHIGHO2_02_FULL_54_22]|uniref:Translation initiation factor IF-2 n=1 Tax=Candidatus Kaiserbacteria bacterium RIFCSPHIGHO2_02_FULL_54_22 TaxID=1798495 RepID=A0A1F6DN67_9BACT|nr:MAG: translation initiation factor IF-2 [Candidatus Kaiserbacteria bacterium RIFCSPHIGHO2_02_FULL_54_22]OGG68069.1 MAG: translation initiation factor IF-2 [Candidatus Kaiserbacteria bacterium RIFCSPHIGHO2_12_FULL_54_16]OGG90774.1 MAG: translation initiation factor IF-2 [Candidatus Kaiserbacteria bacterium RIFCSPLOWO2_12_FULL_54_10]